LATKLRRHCCRRVCCHSRFETARALRKDATLSPGEIQAEQCDVTIVSQSYHLEPARVRLIANGSRATPG
jgi:hypothetical protein